MQVPLAPGLSDANNWNQPEYYETIQSADIDGDEIAELLARSADGIDVWKYDTSAQQWDPLPTCTRFSDSQGWNATPAYYSTILFADIDGDNVAEAVGRGGEALYVWKYNPSTQAWGEIGELPDLSDNNTDTETDWSQPQYYITIVYGDLLGGQQELVIARAKNGILTCNTIPVYP